MSFSDELPARCDVVNVLDAFRHFGDPHGLLRLWRRIIREGGLLLIAEPADAGTLDANTADVAAVIGLGCLLLYCDVGGRTGDPATEPLSPQPTAHSPQPTAHSPQDGGAALVSALDDAGLAQVASSDVAGGYGVHVAR